MKQYCGIFICMIILLGSGCAGISANKTRRVAVPFTMTKNDDLLIKAKINDKDVCFIVDTAAGTSTIHKKDIEYLGLKLGKSSNELRGLGTSSYTMHEVNVPVMSLGGMKFLKPSFIAVELHNIGVNNGLLGSLFLRKHDAIIDFKKNIIFLKPPTR